MLTEVETRSDKRFFLHFAARAVFEAGDVHAFLNLVAARALFEEGGAHAFLNYFVRRPPPRALHSSLPEPSLHIIITCP
jgi:hypothetical protein